MDQTTRRRILHVVGVGGVTGIAGCTGLGDSDNPQPADGDDDDGNVASHSGFKEFAEALTAVGSPWAQSATEITEEMVEAIEQETADLLQTAVAGSSTSALTDIIEATQTAFRQLWEGQKAFEMELLRSEMKAAVANNSDIKQAYSNNWDDDFSGIGKSYRSMQPYVPLYQALVEDLQRLANQDTIRNRRIIRNHANSIEYIFTTSRLLDRLKDHSGKTGAKPLINALKFLTQSVGWIQSNIEPTDTPTPTTDTTPHTEGSPSVVDGFEDGDISEYSGQTDGFRAQQSVVADGAWALKGEVQHGDNQEIYRDVSLSQPSSLQGYVRVGEGGGNEDAVISYFSDGINGPRPIEIHIDMNSGNSGFGDTSGDEKLFVNSQPVMDDIAFETWYFVELEDIDWNREIVGEVYVNNARVAEEVSFGESAARIDTLAFKVADWGNEPAWFDAVTIG